VKSAMSWPSAQLNGAAARQERTHEALRRYDELKFELARIGQAGMQSCRELKDEEGERLYQSLLARLAEDRFNLAVLGPFNRGKSTLMNAILGTDRLPTGVLPHTSVITTVTYGSQERVLIRCAGWSLPQEVPLEKLADYVTEQGNPSNQRQVTLADIQVPSEILRRGFSFIDTPGVGSGIAANTTATEGFVPEVDAAIFVSSFESPTDENELRFLRRVYEEVGRVFVVINKLDLLPEAERDKVIAFVHQRLESELGGDNYGLFALSAKGALEAKLRGDAAALTQSGLPQLEQALTGFLSTDKTQQFCSRTLYRLVALLKRQQLELAISLAMSTSSNSVKELRDQFRREVDELSAHASSTASRLRVKLSNEIAKELRGPLDGFFGELTERANRKSLSLLSARSVLFHPSESGRVLQETAALCEQTISKWLSAIGPLTIQPAVEKIGGQTLADLTRLPAAVPQLAAELVGSQIELPSDAPAHEVDHAVECDLALPRLSHTAWTRRPPSWLCLVPFHWLEGAVRAWFKEVCDVAIGEYRRQVEALLRASVEDYVDNLVRRVQRQIAERGARIAGYIDSKEQAGKADLIRDLLRRAANVRERLESSQTRFGGNLADLSGSEEFEAAPEADTALSEEPCPICGHAAEMLFAFLSKHQFTISASEAAQASHAESGGFCALHTWMYSEMTSPQGICRAYPALLTSLSQSLWRCVESGCGTDDLEVMLRRILRQAENCPACGIVEAAEREAASDVIRRYSDRGFTSAGLPVLCVAHLRKALAARPEDALARALSERTAKALNRSAENMRRYGLKHDAIRRNLVTHEERIAWILGLARVARDKRLAPRWAKDEF